MTARRSRASRSSLKIALTIAGSDPTGGAGIQGDLRTFAALSVHGLSAITCLTAQGTRGVRDVVAVRATLLRAQLDALVADVTIDAIKTGALATAANVRVVIDLATALPAVPLVVDPVIASSSGAALLDARGVRLLIEALMPRATLITPNVDELRLLLGDRRRARDVAALVRAAERLRERGARAVLAKGGHLDGEPIDVLVDASGTRVLRGRRIETTCTHGTGCTLASAIAAELAKGASLAVAARRAKTFVSRAMNAGVPIGPGTSPLGHFFARRLT